jgi:GT2 family glycosyltransferase
MVTASDSPSAAIVIGNPHDDLLPDARLADLLTGPFGIGAVVPSEAGPHNLALPVARDVASAASHALAVRADVLMAADLDPRERQPERVIAAALTAVRSQGLRIVSDPAWTTAASSGATSGAQMTTTRLLLVTGGTSGDYPCADDRAVRSLIRSLNTRTRDNELTVLSVEQLGTNAARWRAEGIAVIDGRAEWTDLSDQLRGHFSHVVLAATGLRSAARRWIDTTQPQAARVLYLPSLPFREVTALAPITPMDEVAGLELVRVGVEASVADEARWADAVWCEDERDASFVSGLLPSTPVTVIAPLIEGVRAPVPLVERRGVVIAAIEGHDVIAANEDAALRALQDVLPQLRRRDGTLECTVLSDRPTPMLEAAVRRAGVSLVPGSELLKSIGSARVVVAAHGYGSGQRHVMMESLAAGTPFIATPQATGGLDLGPLGPIAIFGDDVDIAARVSLLLSDDVAWRQWSDVASQLVNARYGHEQRTLAIRAALAPLGITPGHAIDRWPGADIEAPHRRVGRGRPARLRPAGFAPPSEPPEREHATERDRYASWVSRYGPNSEVRRALRTDLESLQYRPLISVVMPVYNTDRQVLVEAVDSVRAQIYDKWQLCIANDGSTNPETIEVLESLAGEKAVRIVDLPGGSGISGATNAALALADGEFIAFLDHDDLLKPHALAQVARWLDADPTLDVVYSDEDKLDGHGHLYDPHLKPDWSPDQLMSQNYVCHLTVVRRELMETVGGLRSEYDGSQDYDLILRLAEQTERIGHIPEPLYSWRAVPGSAAAEPEAKPYAIQAARRALSDALTRRGYDGRVDETRHIGIFRCRYPIPGKPRVSIVIPTRDGVHLLRRCVESILERSTYPNFDFLVVDNQSTDGDTLSYLAQFPGRVIRYPHRFNYARMMNLAARSVECDALLFLNNDTEIITPDWIEALLEHAMRPEVGAVGCRLYFENGEPQHEGILVGVGGGWAHNLNHKGYWARGDFTRNVSAVTGACIMIRPSVYWRVGGNDERLRVAYNDVDLCLRIRQAGYQVVYTPAAELYHYESSSRGGYEHHEDGPLFGIRWHPKEFGDAYYSPVFDIHRPFEIRI